MERAYIGVGSNVDPEQNVRQALRLLTQAVRVTGISNFYLTTPVGGSEQPQFYNGVVEVETDLPPLELKFAVLRKIERELGRQRAEDKYAPRPIDLDILLYDKLVMRQEALVIPDPQIPHRAFLAIPLCELAPDLVLPDTGQRIAEIAQKIDADIQPLPAYTEKLRKDILHE